MATMKNRLMYLTSKFTVCTINNITIDAQPNLESATIEISKCSSKREEMGKDTTHITHKRI